MMYKTTKSSSSERKMLNFSRSQLSGPNLETVELISSYWSLPTICASRPVTPQSTRDDSSPHNIGKVRPETNRIRTYEGVADIWNVDILLWSRIQRTDLS